MILDELKRRSELLRTRIITAVIAGLIVCALLVWGSSVLVMCCMGVGTGICTYELTKMLSTKFKELGWIESGENRCKRFYPVFMGVIVGGLFVILNGLVELRYSLEIITLVFVVGSCWLVFSRKEVKEAFVKIIMLGFSFIYVLASWCFIYRIYERNDSLKYIVLLFAIVWGADIGGYFGGRFLGKHKLAEKISPKKTIEGAVCSVLSSLVLYWIFIEVFDISQSWYMIILVSTLVSVCGIAGDLVESSIKRFCDVKDSGRILPGHGGLLDRVDALMFGAGVFYFILIAL